MTWKEFHEIESQKEYFKKLNSFIDSEYKTKTIFPKKEDIYKAFDLTPLDKVKVVIIGQDPYQTPGFAMGLAFSVNDGCVIPRSLNNIFKELHDELGLNIPKTGNLSDWARKGILLLNRILTVESNVSLSHKNKGWEEYTLNAVKLLNEQSQKIVYILLGNEAIKLKEYLNNPAHLVLTAAHPSPLSARRGFFGSNIFKRTIEFLNVDKTLWEV